MKEMVNQVSVDVEALFTERKHIEKEIKELEATEKEYNKEIRQIDKELKELKETSEQAIEYKEKKQEIKREKETIEQRIQARKELFAGMKKARCESILEKMQPTPVENPEIKALQEQIEASHVEEENNLQAIDKKIEGLEKLNRAEMPENFRDRIQKQVKELKDSKKAVQKSFNEKRDNLTLKIEGLQQKLGGLEEEGTREALEKIVACIQEEDWKQAEKLWKPYQVKETNEEEVKMKTVEKITENPQPEEHAVEKVEVEPVVEMTEPEKVVEKAENQPETPKQDVHKVHSIYVDFYSEKIYADVGDNQSEDYNFEEEMRPAMLHRDNKLQLIRKHIANFDKLSQEKENERITEKGEEEYQRYIELFDKADPFVVHALQDSHEDMRQYLKALKSGNKDAMPFKLYYNMKKLVESVFTEEEQDEIIYYVENNASLASQVRAYGKAKRDRNWRKFESKHKWIRAFMKWLRMEDGVPQITDGK